MSRLVPPLAAASSHGARDQKHTKNKPLSHKKNPPPPPPPVPHHANINHRYPTKYHRVGGAYGSLARCGVLPVMSSDVHLVSIDEGSSVRKVVTSKVVTSGTQPMPRAYGSLVLLTNGAS